MSEDEFRTAMNAANREARLLWLTNGSEIGIALGYDRKSGEAIFFGNNRAPLKELSEVKT